MASFPLAIGLLILILVGWSGRTAVATQGGAAQLPLHLLLCWALPGDLLLLEELGQA